jgi:Cu(I)/Ag(I) efflux system membrane fusion protein
VCLIVGLFLGAGVAIAHFQGYFSSAYHALGLHSLMVEETHPANRDSSTPAALGGHAGHGSKPTGGAEAAKLPGYSIVNLTPERIQLIGVRIGKVQRDKLLMSIRAVGIIEPDQTKLARLHTRISGWVTKVHVNFIGQNVKKGDPLLEIYSPDLVTTQDEYLIAYGAWETAGKTDAAWRLVESSRRRLELWGVSQEDIKDLVATRKARESLTLRAPIDGRVLERNVLQGSQVDPAMELYRIADLSTVWLQARVYEYELPHIEIGQPAHVTLLSEPDKMIHGKISFIEPVLQEMTRTVKVRVPIDNPKDIYKPGMYADLKIDHDMGTGLLVPQSALLRTGERDIAFRVLGEGRFGPVEVKLGSRFGERYEVLSGLSEGDEVVTSATFLIDAESRLKAAVSEFGGGHKHGSGKAKTLESSPKALEHDHSAHQHNADEPKKAPEPPAKAKEHDHSQQKH